MYSYDVVQHHNTQTQQKKQQSFDKKHLQQPNPTTQPILTLVAPMLAAWAPAKNGSYVGSPRENISENLIENPPDEDAPCFHMKNSEAWEFC